MRRLAKLLHIEHVIFNAQIYMFEGQNIDHLIPAKSIEAKNSFAY